MGIDAPNLRAAEEQAQIRPAQAIANRMVVMQRDRTIPPRKGRHKDPALKITTEGHQRTVVQQSNAVLHAGAPAVANHTCAGLIVAWPKSY